MELVKTPMMALLQELVPYFQEQVKRFTLTTDPQVLVITKVNDKVEMLGTSNNTLMWIAVLEALLAQMKKQLN